MRTLFSALALPVLAGCHSDSESEPLPVPVAFNLQVAGERVFGTGSLRLVSASETDQGQDLDGDGDTADRVWQLVDLPAFSLVNLGLALPGNVRQQRDEVPPPEPAQCSDALAAFLVSEAESGADLDMDGVPDETATWIFGRGSGSRALDFAHSQVMLDGDLAALVEPGDVTRLHVFDVRDGSLTTLPDAPGRLLAVGDGIVAFALDEAGLADLNGDGDALDDSVLHLYDSDTRLVENAGFAISPFSLRIEKGWAGFVVGEAENGEMDLDGDGDATDSQFVALEARTGLTRIPGLDVTFFGEVFLPRSDSDPETFLLPVSEQDADRNGDGDTLDRVLVRYDPRTDRILDPGLAIGSSGLAPDFGVFVQAPRWFGASVMEVAQGELDLDGDGRADSGVPHVVDASSGRSVNLRFRGVWLAALEDQLLGMRFVRIDATGIQMDLFAWDPRARAVRMTGVDGRGVLGISGDDALVVVAEGVDDRNGDGDTEDAVLGLYEGRTRTVRNLRLATSNFEGSLGAGGQAAVLISEQAQGEDLNGDGDELDQVLHQIVLDPPRG